MNSVTYRTECRWELGNYYKKIPFKEYAVTEVAFSVK